MNDNRTVVGVEQCRICGNADLTPCMDFGAQPLANAFLDEAALSQPEPTYPLRVLWCTRCHLVQLADVVDPRVMFAHYVYHSSGMPAPKHFRDYAEQIVSRFIRSPQERVVEIGSNDGHFLAVVKETGTPVLGVDPALNIAQIANDRGVPTIADFFGERVAQQIVRDHGPAQVIVGNNVVAHINDHHDLLRGVTALLSDDGVFVLEAPYLVDMFENLTYDTIYHEHLSYLAVRPLQALFHQYGMEIFDVELHQVQGQSLRVFACRQGTRPVEPSVAEFVRRESDWKLDQLASYQRLSERIAASKNKLVNLLQRLRREGNTIAAYGAPAKGNTLLNYCRIGPDILDYAHEDLPAKVGLYTPGMHIRVVDRPYTQSHWPKYFLLLAWNYLEPILAKEAAYRRQGGKFIIPVGDEIRVM
ncbi:MAG: class I SAM-dependent methyltransferase [Patescibacteria group bacterium]|nr:class I SAM-dependent methyltransferase [Patescibacteria group bacterium]